jgi:RNA polymerase sigma-70 factor (ECF subfamily)
VSWDGEHEQALVEAAQNGDGAAFRQLYDHYLPLIYARVRALVPRAHAEDVTQEVVLSVARSIRSYRGRSSFSTWVYSILKRRVADYYRHAARQVPQVPLADGCEAPTEDKQTESDETFIVRQVFLALPEAQREVILLRLVEGLSFQEVGSRLGIEIGAAKMRFYRAIAACRERLEETAGQDVAFSGRRTTNEEEEP